MRWMLVAVAGLVVSNNVSAQQYRAATPTFRDVQTVAVRVRSVVEQDRLVRAGFDGAAAMRELAPVFEKQGLKLVDDASKADGLIEVTVVCAGPDTGNVGCSAESLALTLSKDGRAVPTSLLWASPRHFFSRNGWSAMAKSGSALFAPMVEELFSARQRLMQVAATN